MFDDPGRGAWSRSRRSRPVRTALTGFLAIALIAPLTAAAVPTPVNLPSQQPAVPGTPVIPHTVAASNGTKAPAAPARPAPAKATWPAAVSAGTNLAASTRADALAPAAGWSAAAHPVPGTPISVHAVGPLSAAATSSSTHSSATAAPTAASTSVSTTVLSHSAAAALGVDGVVFSLTPGPAVTSQLGVSLDYSAFADATGGGYGDRLRLVELPACALTTPNLAACRVQTPISSAQNDFTAATLTATVAPQAVASPSSAAPAPGARSGAVQSTKTTAASPNTGRIVVLAAAAGPSGPTGNFNASSLSPDGSWSGGGDDGSFTWSYPITVPPVAAGSVAPSIALSYDSASVDGETGTTNNQSSWIGQGWDYDPGYIERTYQTCSDDTSLPKADQTGDECWDGQILTLSLNGQTEQIVQDDTTGAFHLQGDDGSRLEHLTSAADGNGAQNGEYWRLTTTDGTQYYFGLNKLPGYTNQTTTNSVFTEPVYGPGSTDPCYSASGFTSSVCTQAWRWNLDYVVDVHGNAAAYYYSQETNYYTPDNGQNSAKPVSYVRGGELTTIDYGLRQENGSIYGSTAPDQVSFATAERCFASGSITCDPSQFTAANANYWPDTPQDLQCTSSTSTCSNYSPSMWSTRRLTTITTQIWNSSTSAYQPVDSYALSQDFPSTGDAELTLAGITHTGYDSTGANPLSEPEITFEGQLYDNRVGGYGSLPPLAHWRMYNIVSQTGETISVTYDTPQCTISNLPPTTDTTAQQQAFASTNTMNCYPVFWTPPGYSAPTFDYFDKYTVASVQVSDPKALAPKQITNYYYLGGAAWHYDDNQVVKPSQRTYGQFRGYGVVESTTGDTTHTSNGVADGLTLTKDTYFRGMDQNTLPNNGVQSASVTDSLNEKTTDSAAFAGQVYESQVFNGATIGSDGLPVAGPEVSATITDPEIVATTASRAVTGLPTVLAQLTGTASTRTYTDLAAGGTSLVQTDDSYDSAGRVVASQSSGTKVTTTCTTTSYADNTTTWVRQDAAETIEAAQSCPSTVGSALTATDIMRDTRNYYDGSTSLGTLPGDGDLTRTDVASVNTNGTLTWVTDDTQATYDSSGRSLTSTDALGHVTKMSYTPADGGLLTQKAVSNPICAANPSGVGCGTTITVYSPGHGSVTSSTNPAHQKTTAQYDSLGRLTSVWTPGFVQGLSPASTTYSYVEQNDGPESVTTKTLVDDGAGGNNLNYTTTVTLADSLGQKLQTQTTGENGSVLATDTFYDSHGWVVDTNNQYATNGAPSTSLISVATGAVNSRSQTAYDGDGRATLVTQYNGTTPTSAVQTVYGGDRTTTIGRMADAATFDPGVTAATTITNARGQTVELDQYTGAPTVAGSVVTGPATGTIPGTAGTLKTTYTVDALGEQTGVADSAGDKWTNSYDLLGRVVAKTDPDTGATTTNYDNDGDVLSTKDADGNVVSYTYDLLNRKVAQYGSLTQNPSTQTGAWLWDTEQNGQLTTTSTMNVPLANGTTGTITDQADGYDVAGRSGGSIITIPSGETGLGGTYTTAMTYSSTGLVTSVTPAAMPGSPTETVKETYDSLGNPQSEAGYNTIVSAATYTPYAAVAQLTLGASNAPVWQTYTYDPQTGNVTNVNVSAQLASPQLDSTQYTYDPADQITSITDTQGNGSTAPVEQQCYSYDALGRLTEAYTAAAPTTDGSCPDNPSTAGESAVGGPEPYWTSWTFDQLGQRTSQDQHALTGQSADTDATYTYGQANHAHALNSISTTSPAGTTNLTGYVYDNDGNATTYPSAGGSGTQTLGWNDQGVLVSDNTASGDHTTQVDDADGNQLITRDSSTSTDTLYLAGEQLAYDTATGSTVGTRYYSVGTDTVAERVGGGNPQYLVSDQHGTNLISVDSVTMNVTRREMDPYGNQISATTGGTWPDNRGFLDKPQDAATGLVDIGARQFDPATGRFLTVDSVLEATDPQEVNGYTYSADDPINGSDPTGDYRDCGPDEGCGTPGNNTPTTPTPCGSGQYRDGSGNCVDDTLTIKAPDGKSKTVDADASPFGVLDAKRYNAELSYLRHQGYQGSSSLTYTDLLNWALSNRGGELAWMWLTQLAGLSPQDAQADPVDRNPDIYRDSISWRSLAYAVAAAVSLPLALGAIGACLPVEELCTTLTVATLGTETAANVASHQPIADTLVEMGAWANWTAVGIWVDLRTAETEFSTLGTASRTLANMGNEGLDVGSLQETGKSDMETSPGAKPATEQGSVIYATNAQGKPDPSFSQIMTVGFTAQPYQ
jgi:RHS repeat-associated protein